MKTVKLGGDAKGQKGKNLQMTRRLATLIVVLSHLLLRIFFNKLRHKRPRLAVQVFFQRDNAPIYTAAVVGD